MATCPTVRIKSDAKGHEEGLIINESDFDPNKHELFDAPKTAPKRGRPPGTSKK